MIYSHSFLNLTKDKSVIKQKILQVHWILVDKVYILDLEDLALEFFMIDPNTVAISSFKRLALLFLFSIIP